MGYPDVQDGRPPRSRAGAGLPGSPDPVEMPGEEEAGYRSPLVPGADGGPWRGNGPADRPAYPGGAGGGRAYGGPGYRDPGFSGPAYRGDSGGFRDPGPSGSRGGPGYDSDTRGPGYAGGTGNGGPGYDSQRPGSRTGAHRAGPGSGAAAGAGAQQASRPAAAARPTGRRRAPTGLDDRAGAPHRRPPDAGRGWPGSPAPAGAQAPGRPRPDNPDDGPGLAITRERPGASRAGPPGGAPPPAGRLGPIRGYPPRPGQPDPVYPPGQFSPWNRASTRAAWMGIASAREGSGADTDPGYSALALSDAAADLTSTQTWAVIDDEPLPSPPAAPGTRRDWGSHAEEAGPGWQRGAAGRPTGGSGAGGSAASGRGTGPGDRLGSVASPRGPGDRLGSVASPRGPGDRLGSPAGAVGGPGARDRGQPGAALAARQGMERQVPAVFGETEPGRRSRAAADGFMAAGDGTAATGRRGAAGRRSGKRGGRHNIMMAGLLLAPVLVVVLVVAGYVYLNGRHAPAVPRAAAGTHPTAAPSAAAAAPGPWKHIESRSQDPVPLTVTELFPAKFTQGGEAGTLTVSKSGSKCPREVIGSKLAAAIRKAGCTQVLRASYLSTDRKIMATVGVLNLANAAAAQKAGKAAGAMEFIKQLPSAHGPTRNIAKGTGIVEAEFKGHYLILTWTEFANLHAPSGKRQKQKLVAFSAGLVAGTANVSLTTRMVTGHPPAGTSNS